MIGRDGYPPGVPCWIDTEQPDPSAAIAFYGGLFGWQFEDRIPPGAPGRYAVAQLQGLDVAAVASADPGAGPPVWNTYVWVDDVEATTSVAARAGGAVLAGALDVGPAGRMAVIADPSGAPLRLWQAGTNRGAGIVNAPGTWNWSNLHTPDVDAARAFYAAVFGWAALDVEIGGGTATMWRRPGYGDFLEVLEPGLRSRQDADGVPPGFADAIAWVMPAADGEEPRWSVTFAVDDTDAVVQRALDLGGEVRVAPFDAGPVRAADLADPQGTGFSVNSYDPSRI